MDVLVIGGTRFVGRHLVDAAVEAGHRVTVLHRGSTPLHRDDVEEVLGDRNHDLDRLSGRSWEVVFDTCGYLPTAVEASARALADAVERYVFVSSVSAYLPPVPVGSDESAALHPPAAPGVDEVTGETYGPLKVACEQAVGAALPGRVLIIRPGLVVGPHDPTGRFTYWVARFADGGDVVVPDRDQPMQVIDARDLGALMVQAAASGVTGALNATGPRDTLRGVLDAIAGAVGAADVTQVPVSEGFLVERGVAPWEGLPMWLGPEGDPGMMAMDSARARAVGLRCRPVAETAADTLEWLNSSGRRAGDGAFGSVRALERDQERELLAAWRERTAQGQA